MSAVAKLKAALGMDAAQYKAGMKNATGETDKFQNKIKTVGASMAAAFSVGAILNFARQATSLGSQLSDLASQSGINVETFQALEIAAINAGTGPEKLRTAMAKIGQTLGQARGGMKTYIDLLERAGLSQEQIARATPTETLEVLAKTVTNGQKGMADYEAVMQILGTRTGPLLIEVLNRIANEGIDNITKKAKESGQVIDAETIQRLDKMEDRLQRVSRTAKLKFGEAMVRVIDDVELLSTAGGAAVAFLTDRTVTFADAWQTVKDKVNEAKDAIDDAKAAEEDRPGRDIDPLREAIEKETRGGFTPEEAAERGKEAEKRQTKLIERQQKAAFDRLTTTEKIAQLEKEIATIQESRRKGQSSLASATEWYITIGTSGNLGLRELRDICVILLFY